MSRLALSSLACLGLLLSLAGCGGDERLVGRLAVVYVDDPQFWAVARPVLERAAAGAGFDLVFHSLPAGAKAKEFVAKTKEVARGDVTHLLLAPPAGDAPGLRDLESATGTRMVVLFGPPVPGLTPDLIIRTPWPAIGRQAVALAPRGVEDPILLLPADDPGPRLALGAAVAFLDEREQPYRFLNELGELPAALEAGASAVLAFDPDLTEGMVAALAARRTDGPMPFRLAVGRSEAAVATLEARQLDFLVVPEWDRQAARVFEFLRLGKKERRRVFGGGDEVIDAIYAEPGSAHVVREALGLVSER